MFPPSTVFRPSCQWRTSNPPRFYMAFSNPQKRGHFSTEAHALRYFIYARKSTDEQTRQVLSIDSQLRELRDFALTNKLNIVAEFHESRTAKAPGRPVFNEMMDAL